MSNGTTYQNPLVWFLWWGGFLLFCLGSCHGATSSGVERDYQRERAAMVQLLQAYGIQNQAILTAMGKIPRHLFIPPPFRGLYNPYGDFPCPIGFGQTISQPYIVAYMTEKMKLHPQEKVLEIGTGSGYQAAVLAELGVQVFSIEIIAELAQHATLTLKNQGFSSVRVRHGDGYQGWPEHAPYDAIIVTCAPENVPPKLTEQLKEGGRMILPLGKWNQQLIILRKKKGTISREEDLAVRFVPMVHGK